MRMKRSEAGAAAVEFAVLAPVFFMMIFGLIDCARLYWLQSSMTYAVEAGSRYAMLNISASDDDVIARAKENLYGIDPSAISFTSANASLNNVNFKTVRAQTMFSFIPGGLSPYGNVMLVRQVRVPLFP